MKNGLLFCFLAIACRAFAQQPDSLLREVTVLDERYIWLKTAQFSVQPDSIQQKINPVLTAAEWLPQESSVHVRQYAPGMVASYSAHGATSAQNAVLWGGIPINSPATGLTDLALLPTSIFSSVFLRGGSSAQFGSGAMGSVLALQTPAVKDSLSILMSVQSGSFSTLNAAQVISYATKKYTYVSRLFGSQSYNNYTFPNHYKAAQPWDTMQGAAYEVFHFIQSFEYRLNTYNRLDAEVWYSYADRETPNNILVNTPSQAKLEDKNWRARAGWHFAKGKHKADIGYAFLHEWQRYTNPLVTDINGHTTDDTNRTVSQVVRADYILAVSKKLFWQNGLQYRFDKVSGSNRLGTQNISSVQTGLFFKTALIEAQANIRAEIWDGQLLPISPFASAKWFVGGGFSVSAFGGYNYRVPSMNDRFWVPGGNPDLKPENGWSYEVSANYIKALGNFNVNLRAAFYQSLVNDLIQWLPSIGSIWTPENVKQVRMQGADVNVELSYPVGPNFFRLRGGWSFNQSTVLQSHKANDQSVGGQLIYQPEFKATHSLQYSYSRVSAQITHRFVGQVYTNYASLNNTLPAYNLFDVGAAYTFKKPLFWFRWTLALNINNITNAYYENIAYFPMPGINFNFSINIQL
jgi:iron complex outermembrane receptor protein